MKAIAEELISKGGLASPVLVVRGSNHHAPSTRRLNHAQKRKMAKYLRSAPPLALLAILGVALLLFVGQAHQADADIPAGSVEATPDTTLAVGKTSQYTISWTTDGDYSVGFIATATFPAGTTVPAATVTAANTLAGFGTGVSTASARQAAVAALAGANVGGVAVAGQTVTVTTAVMNPPTPNADGLAGNGDDIMAIAVRFTVAAGIQNPPVDSNADTVTVATNQAGGEATKASADINFAETLATAFPPTANEVAEYAITFDTAGVLPPNVGEIKIMFDKDVKVPKMIGRANVLVQADKITNACIGTPPVCNIGANQLVSVPFDPTFDADPADPRRSVVALKVPDMNPDTTAESGGIGAQGIDAGAKVRVIFTTGAGIVNPIDRGKIKLDVRAFAIAGSTDLNAGDTVTKEVTITSAVTLDKADGRRDTALTIKGQGFQRNSSATIWLDSGVDLNGDGKISSAAELALRGNAIRDTGEAVIANDVPVDANGKFSVTITVNVPPFRVNNPAVVAGGPGVSPENIIAAIDSRNNKVDEALPTFGLRGTMAVMPKDAAWGGAITLTLKDFSATTLIPAGAITLGPSVVAVPGAGGAPGTQPVTDADGEVTFSIIVPPTVPLGQQTLTVNFAGSGNRTLAMTIRGGVLLLASEKAVPNQTLTIFGGGFTTASLLSLAGGDRAEIDTISIDGEPIAAAKINEGRTVLVDSGGNWSASVTIPITIKTTTAGLHMLKATDRVVNAALVKIPWAGQEGAASLVIPMRSLILDPAASRSGTTVRVHGAGFPAHSDSAGAESDRAVEIKYGLPGLPRTVTTVAPDASGNFETSFKVPSGAVIPSTNIVEARFTTSPAGAVVTTTTTHSVPGAAVTISPTAASPGSAVTVTGINFPAFASIRELTMGDIDVRPSPTLCTGAEGDLKGTVLVPQLAIGSYTVTAKAEQTTARTIFTVTAYPAPPPVDWTPVAVALAHLGANLVRVWDFEAGKHLLFDPAAPAAVNDVTALTRGRRYWINVKAPQTVTLGAVTYTLEAGWNLIAWLVGPAAGPGTAGIGPTQAPTPPHRFFGTATDDGRLVPAGTVVTAEIQGDRFETAATCGGHYRIDLVQPERKFYTGTTVTFTIRGLTAKETGMWDLGGLTNVNLTVSSPSNTVVETLAPLSANLVRVWGFNAGAWQVYDPASPIISDLEVLTRGRGYYIMVSANRTVTLGGFTYTLVPGWNLIGWLG